VSWDPNNPEELAAAAFHYTYEIERAFLHGWEVVHPSAAYRGYVFDALVEAFLCHCRLLHEFYSRHPPPRPGKRDDVVAGHFVNWETVDLLDAREWDDVNGQVSHLAGRRVIARQWPVGDILGRLATTHLEFARGVDADGGLLPGRPFGAEQTAMRLAQATVMAQRWLDGRPIA
jgi:hypothetical protein